jgi:hypothetical protein
MSKPIYKQFVSKKLDAWYQLSEEEQKKVIAKLDEAFDKVGGKKLILIDSSWSSDQWSVSGVEEFPNIEAVQDYMAALNKLNWFRYNDSKHVFGTRLES